MDSSLAPFVPTSLDIARRMLELAKTGKDDVVFDLGCGDGRIVRMAVKDFGVRKAVGYEIRVDLHEQALEEVKRVGLETRITIFNDDLLKADLGEATVITLYLTTSGNESLRPKLENEASDGTRVVSHDFDFRGWNATIKESFYGHTLYLFNLHNAHMAVGKNV